MITLSPTRWIIRIFDYFILKIRQTSSQYRSNLMSNRKWSPKCWSGILLAIKVLLKSRFGLKIDSLFEIFSITFLFSEKLLSKFENFLRTISNDTNQAFLKIFVNFPTNSGKFARNFWAILSQFFMLWIKISFFARFLLFCLLRHWKALIWHLKAIIANIYKFSADSSSNKCPALYVVPCASLAFFFSYRYTYIYIILACSWLILTSLQFLLVNF